MTKTIANIYNITSNYRTVFTYMLLFGCFLMVLIYALNVYRVITTTVSVQKIENETALLHGSVEKLDSKYLELSSRITPDTLSAHGFVPGNVSAYISRNVSVSRLTIGGHEL